MQITKLAAASARASRQDNVLSSAELASFGLDAVAISRLASRGVLRRLYFGIYLVDADLFPETPRRALLRGALRRYGKDAVLWGASAAEVWQIEGMVGWPAKPWILLPLDQPKPPDPRVRLRFRLPCPSETTTVDGFAVNVVTRTLADLVPEVDRAVGLSLFDSALHRGQLSAAAVADVCELARGRRGAPRVREMASFADGRAANPLESRIRLACIDGNVAPDELQWPVLDRHGQPLGIGDLAWLRNRRRPLVGEADGEEPHSRLVPLFRDRRRGNDFTGAAVDTVRFTWADGNKPAYVASVVRRSLLAA